MTKENITWFDLMWSNKYIQLFALALLILYIMIFVVEPVGWEWAILTIPIGMMIAISYFGFYKFWKEYNND